MLKGRGTARPRAPGGGGTGASKPRLPEGEERQRCSQRRGRGEPFCEDAFCDAGSKRMMKHADAKAASTDRESPGAQDPPTAGSAASSSVPLRAAKASTTCLAVMFYHSPILINANLTLR